MKNLFHYFLTSQFLETLVMIALMFVLLIIIKNFLIKRVAYKTYSKKDQKTSTFIGVVFNILQYVVILITVFVVLDIHGVNITGMLAGIGIVATIVGLSLQDTLKDILSGINIYNNNFYKVNDIVRYNNELCEVKYFNARVTKLRSMYTNSTYTIPNSSIGAIEKVKDFTPIFIEFPFSTDDSLIKKSFNEASDEIKKVEGVTNVIVVGCVGFLEHGLKYCLVIECPPKEAFDYWPNIVTPIVTSLKANGIAPVNSHHLKIEQYK